MSPLQVGCRDARQGTQQRSVGGFEAGSWHLTVQDRELMSQDEDLDILATVPAAAQHQELDHEADKTVEVGHWPDPRSAQTTSIIPT
jgi:hypothetical protein